MKDPRNTTIAVLCVTACLMGLAAWYITGSTAEAASSQTVATDYIMVTGSISGSEDLLYVIDTVSQRMNGYQIDRRAGAILLVPKSVVNLKNAFDKASAARTGAARPR